MNRCEFIIGGNFHSVNCFRHARRYDCLISEENSKTTTTTIYVYHPFRSRCLGKKMIELFFYKPDLSDNLSSTRTRVGEVHRLELGATSNYSIPLKLSNKIHTKISRDFIQRLL